MSVATWRSRTVVGTTCFVGLAIRFLLVSLPPLPSVEWDHHEYVQWGRQMLDHGVLSVYDSSPPAVPMWSYEHGRSANAIRADQTPCNYPPLAVYLIFLEAWALEHFSDEFVSNTPLARMLFSLLSFLADGILAVGVYGVVRCLTERSAAAIGIGVAVFLLPPVLIDSALWTQTDSWVSAPMMWMLWAMMKCRWTTAGVLWGIGLALKTQAVLWTPLWVLAMIVHRPSWVILKATMAAPATLLLLASPFMFHSGGLWFQVSFTENLLHSYPRTTLGAFNFWYVDLLLSLNDNSSARLLGISKDAWGRLFLLSGWIAGGLSIRWKCRSRESQLVRFVALSLLLAVMAPTRVHERYVVLSLPFLICASVRMNRWLTMPLAALVVTASLQMIGYPGSTHRASEWPRIQERIHTQYEQIRGDFPNEDLTELPKPEVRIARVKPDFLADRKRAGVAGAEWSMTLAAILSAVGCLGLLALEKETQRSAACKQPEQDGSAGAVEK